MPPTAVTEQYNERSIFGSARSVPRNSSSDETFALARTWLDDCIRNHPVCNQSRDHQNASRLVDIGQDEHNTAIKLITFPMTPVSYTALSYCWGSSVPLKTEKSSLEARMAGISWSSLPKTFQDAIVISRKLGYRYIWIDSLCIVQDDQSDWERESAKMGDIFESAEVTLSAAFGADSTAGCFHDRYHWSSTTVQIGCRFDKATVVGEDRVSFTYQVSDGSSQTVYIERCPEHESLHHGLRFEATEPSPIFNRAWTLQERLLSRRILQFTRTELCWECRTLLDCECGYINAHIWLKRSDLGRNYVKFFSGADISVDSAALDEVGHPIPRGFTEASRYHVPSAWTQLVREYSQRKLSYPTDKLAAFSALAKRMMRPQYGVYCAGLWEAHLPAALLWTQLNHFHAKDTKSLRDALPYRAPSWSWASVDGDTYYIGGNGVYSERIYVDALVKEVSCPPMGLDPTGQVSGGYIVLEAPVVRFKWKIAENKDYPSLWKASICIDGADNEIAWPEFHYISEQSSANFPDATNTDAILFVDEHHSQTLQELEIPETLLFVVIASCYSHSNSDSASGSQTLENADAFQSLVVKESPRRPGTYERVGCYITPFMNCKMGSLANVVEITLI